MNAHRSHMKHTKHRLSFEPVFFCALLIEQFEEEKGGITVFIRAPPAAKSSHTGPERANQNNEKRRVSRNREDAGREKPAFFLSGLMCYAKNELISPGGSGFKSL